MKTTTLTLSFVVVACTDDGDTAGETTATEWLDGGGLENSIGLPSAPEEAVEAGNGWAQEFTNGTISWLADEDGEFSINVQENEN